MENLAVWELGTWYASIFVLAYTAEQAMEIAKAEFPRRNLSKHAADARPEFSEIATGEPRVVGDKDGGHWEGEVRRVRGAYAGSGCR